MKVVVLSLLAVLGFTSAGWMLFDGMRRLIVGDYVRVNGQLGPWTRVVSAVGLDPMSTTVAAVFVCCALFRGVATIGLLARAPWGWGAMLASSIAILWYLPVGTAIAVLTIGLLLLPTGP